MGIATDLHGSEYTFRKLLKGLEVWRPDVLVGGGDVAGKGMLPLVHEGGGRYRGRWMGREETLDGEALTRLEDRAAQAGFYPARLEADEVAACMPYLRAQVGLIRPQVIVLLGSSALGAILGPDHRITRERGAWIERKGVWFMPTYHPAALLRDVDKKRPAWTDFQAIRDKLKELGVYAQE